MNSQSMKFCQFLKTHHRTMPLTTPAAPGPHLHIWEIPRFSRDTKHEVLKEPFSSMQVSEDQCLVLSVVLVPCFISHHWFLSISGHPVWVTESFSGSPILHDLSVLLSSSHVLLFLSSLLPGVKSHGTDALCNPANGGQGNYIPLAHCPCDRILCVHFFWPWLPHCHSAHYEDVPFWPFIAARKMSQEI